MPADKNTRVMVRLSALGDVILTTGVLAHWHETLGLDFICLTRRGFASIYDNHPAVREVVPLDADALRGLSWVRTALDLSRRFRGTELIDLHGNLRTRILKLAWAGWTKGYAKRSLARRLFRLTGLGLARNALTSTNVPQRYALALDDTPPPAQAVRPRIYLRPEEKQRARDLLTSLGLKPPVIALHPYATHPTKAWPEVHWLNLLGLIERQGWSFIVLGQNASPLLGQDRLRRDLTNKTGLRESAALISMCEALISNDSGPMHLGTAVDTPVVGLFGPTSGVWGFLPSGPKDIVLERDLPCRPCSLHGAKRCERNLECLTSIPPEEVFRNLAAMILK